MTEIYTIYPRLVSIYAPAVFLLPSGFDSFKSYIRKTFWETLYLHIIGAKKYFFFLKQSTLYFDSDWGESNVGGISYID